MRFFKSLLLCDTQGLRFTEAAGLESLVAARAATIEGRQGTDCNINI